jgi:hypothetical protein
MRNGPCAGPLSFPWARAGSEADSPKRSCAPTNRFLVDLSRTQVALDKSGVPPLSWTPRPVHRSGGSPGLLARRGFAFWLWLVLGGRGTDRHADQEALRAEGPQHPALRLEPAGGCSCSTSGTGPCGCCSPSEVSGVDGGRSFLKTNEGPVEKIGWSSGRSSQAGVKFAAPRASYRRPRSARGITRAGGT